MSLQITDQNFEELVAQGKPMLIEFGASWCGPCRKIGPYIDEIAKTYEGQALVGKVDIEECDDLVEKFGIRNVPTVLYFKNGEVVDKNVGAAAKAVLEDKLIALL
ncbi:MAG: thioredoxin [Bacteroidaceae bacterium]|jgi:thioredoxin 1|nr:thioredoxin [Bacteroidaceae bacterium]